MSAPPRPQRRWKRWRGYLYVLPYGVFFAVFMLTPFVFGLVLSFFRWEMLSRQSPRFVGLAQYHEAAGDPYFWQALGATVYFVVLAVPLTVLIALLLALGLSRVGRRSSWYRASIFLPTLINITVVAILWQWFFNGAFGVFNHYLTSWGLDPVPWLTDKRYAMPSVVLMTLWWTLGAPTIILLAGLHQVPRQYYEAALIDGAGPWQRLWHITLPLIRPVMLFVVVMTLIGAFQVFGQTYLLTHGGPELSTRVLVQYIYETSFQHFRMGYGAAMSWVLFGVIGVISVVQFYLFREAER